MGLLSERSEGVLLTKLPGFRKIFPYMLPTRTESYIHYEQKIRVKETLALLEQLNEGESDRRYSLFHVMLAAVVRVMALRPDCNRFISGRRIYQRRRIELSFVVKKELTDSSPETTIKLAFSPTDTLPDVAARVWEEVHRLKQQRGSPDEDLSNFATKVPPFMTDLMVKGWKTLDQWNLLPASWVARDSLYCSAFLANLGSIGLPAVQHHLFEWGTCPFFVVLGKVQKELVIHEDGGHSIEEVATSSYTLDERITDGVCYSRTIRLLVDLVEHPQQLMVPPGAIPDPFEYA